MQNSAIIIQEKSSNVTPQGVQGYLLSTLLSAVANYYQKLKENAGQAEPEILTFPWQYEALQQCLVYHFEQKKPFDWPFRTSVVDSENNKVVVKFNGSIVWRLSNDFYVRSKEDREKQWQHPNRAEITIDVKDDAENDQSIIGQGTFSTVKKINFSIKLCGTEKKIIQHIKEQSNKVLKLIHKDKTSAASLAQEVSASKTIYQRRVHAGKTQARFSFFNSIILPQVLQLNLAYFLQIVHANNEKKQGMGHVFPDSMIIIMQHIVCSLRRTHAKGLIHNDVKPENGMIDESFYATLIDHGFTNAELNNDNLHCSPLYAAPEILSRRNFGGENVSSSTAHEVYSLAVFFMEMYNIKIEENLTQFHQVYQEKLLEFKDAIKAGGLAFNAEYMIDNDQKINFAVYLHHSLREMIQDSNCIPENIKILLLQMLSLAPEKRPSLEEVSDKLLQIINDNESDNESDNENSNDGDSNINFFYQDYCAMYQIMMWNSICTEVFVIATRMKKINNLSNEVEQTLSELEELAYVNQDFNALAPENNNQTVGQYRFEQLPLFAKKHEAIEDESLKAVLTILEKINIDEDEDIYSQLLASSRDLANILDTQIQITPNMKM